jgi:hypothetical protein
MKPREAALLPSQPPILVVGAGRSGTSAVAGVLHHLGADMGGPFIGADDNNVYGTFEDRAFLEGNNARLNGVLPREAWLREIEALEKIGESKRIGRKDPASCYFLEDFPHWQKLWCQRDSESVVKSYIKAYGPSGRTPILSEENCRKIAMTRIRLLESKLPPTTPTVSFERLLESPEIVIEMLIEDLSLRLYADEFDRAVEHIRCSPSTNSEVSAM